MQYCGPRWILPAILAIWLSGCAGAVSDCPPLIAYDRERQELLAGELAELADRGVYPTVQRALVEYGQLRAMVRACQPMILF
jgi:hypothetical protein